MFRLIVPTPLTVPLFAKLPPDENVVVPVLVLVIVPVLVRLNVPLFELMELFPLIVKILLLTKGKEELNETLPACQFSVPLLVIAVFGPMNKLETSGLLIVKVLSA